MSVACYSLTISTFAQHVDTVAHAQDQLITRVDSLMAKYKFQRALNILTNGDSLDKNIQLRIGECHFRLGAIGSAILPYERVLRIDSVNITALNQLGQLYARNGDYTKATSVFTRLINLDSTNSYYCKQAGTTALRSDEIMTARSWFIKALELNPTDAETSLALGNILMEMGDYKGVDNITRQALAVDPTYKPMMLLQARSAFEQEKYESVIITINNLLTKSDTTALYARLLGISYFQLKDYSKLVTCMNYLVRHMYDYDWIYYYLGVATRELGDAPASVKWLNLAAQRSISENTRTYYSQLGLSYEEMGNYEEAIRAYRAAYNYSKEGILLYHLARNYDVYYKDKATALLYYQKYLESDDTIRVAREYARKRMQDMGIF